MLRPFLVGLATSYALLTTSCGTCPTCPDTISALPGLWLRSGVSGDHSGGYWLDLRAAGDRVTGTACYIQSGSHVYFRRVAVTGPTAGFSVTFEVPPDADSLDVGSGPTRYHGAKFTGQLRDGVIKGQIAFTSGTRRVETMELRKVDGPQNTNCQ